DAGRRHALQGHIPGGQGAAAGGSGRPPLQLPGRGPQRGRARPGPRRAGRRALRARRDAAPLPRAAPGARRLLVRRHDGPARGLRGARGGGGLRPRPAPVDDDGPRVPRALPPAPAVRPGRPGPVRRRRGHARAGRARARAPLARRHPGRGPFLRRPPRRAAGGGGGLGRVAPVGGGVSARADGALEVLHRDRAALVVVDLQQKLLPAIAEKDRVLGAGLLLIRAARELALPILITTQYESGLGPTVPEVLAEAPDVKPVDKVAFGCFGSPEFLARLAAFPGRDQLLVAGIESHICVAQTVLGALAQGYHVHVAADAV